MRHAGPGQVRHDTVNHRRSLYHSQCTIIIANLFFLEAVISMGVLLQTASSDYTSGETPAHQLLWFH